MSDLPPLDYDTAREMLPDFVGGAIWTVQGLKLRSADRTRLLQDLNLALQLALAGDTDVGWAVFNDAVRRFEKITSASGV
jgi:hypothetical protein